MNCSRKLLELREKYLLILKKLRPFNNLHAGPPDAPTNCSVMNQTTDSLEVECLPGFNGGMDQDFVLEVADLHSKAVLANATDKQPEFTVSILQALKPL